MYTHKRMHAVRLSIDHSLCEVQAASAVIVRNFGKLAVRARHRLEALLAIGASESVSQLNASLLASSFLGSVAVSAWSFILLLRHGVLWGISEESFPCSKLQIQRVCSQLVYFFMCGSQGSGEILSSATHHICSSTLSPLMMRVSLQSLTVCFSCLTHDLLFLYNYGVHPVAKGYEICLRISLAEFSLV